MCVFVGFLLSERKRVVREFQASKYMYGDLIVLESCTVYKAGSYVGSHRSFLSMAAGSLLDAHMMVRRLCREECWSCSLFSH